jgi:hypothetical protein
MLGVAGTTASDAATAPPTTVIGIPSNGATVVGDSWLDAGASSPIGIASVTFEVSGGPNSISDQVVGSGALTLYGYIGAWDSTTVPNGSGYTLQSVATDTTGVSTASAPISITVNNPPPSTAIIVSPGPLDLAQNFVLDALASAGATSVTINAYSAAAGTTTAGLVDSFTLTPTIYGWIYENPANPNLPSPVCTGVEFSALIQSVATYAGGVTVTSPTVSLFFIGYQTPIGTACS